ncbi:hypothetical protein [Hasllibacter sp. MH4015]|uniref:hypothetical protein n=1 Tax=Hasllibacter sp. MH4015 TaxID=2854029 RepID=UPI001CD22B58|nr:hypothetical protein [Hasllibacter sp. MH4015]
MRLLAAILAIFAAAPAAGEGFVVTDLTALSVAPIALDGGTFEVQPVARNRMIVACTDCTELMVIDVVLGRQDDGTEDRLRSGETSIDDIRALCQANTPSCALEGITLGRAIGWVTEYEAGVTGSTTVLFLDGDLLTIRSIAGDIPTARENGDAVTAALAPMIIGAE